MSESQPRFGSSPELDFQDHVRDYLVARHGFKLIGIYEVDEPELAVSKKDLLSYLDETQPEVMRSLRDDYGSDTLAEVLKALRNDLPRRPLWMILRHGLRVRNRELKLFSPKPRSKEALVSSTWNNNRWALCPHFRFGASCKEVDLVLYLNGLPIVTVELKHEAAGQSWADAVAQYTGRDHREAVFRLPFLHIAADTTQVKMATDPRAEANFRWLNAETENKADTEGEYPVEHLYRDVLSPDELAEDISFFLIHVPAADAANGVPSRPSYSIFPRYHQSRMVRKVAQDALRHFKETGNIGKKYLVDHSAGSGKTLSICWLADRIHSLYDTTNGAKLTDIVFILTDRRSLDKNIRDEIVNFTHLKDAVGIAKRSEDLAGYLAARTSIIVTTQQKFAFILEAIENDEGLRKLRVAFLIDEAHRSQEGKLAVAIRRPFREDEVIIDVGEEEPDEEEEIAEAIKRHDRNQLFVAFTATPSPATIQLFGSSFDSYSEEQAIAEGYIVDVAKSILSYSTLYHFRSTIALPDEQVYPKGLVARALQAIAFQDEELIQYKAEVMLRLFEEKARNLIGGRSKAMIVTSSRIAGLRYFRVIQEKLKERGVDYKALYAFSDFEYREKPDSEAISITEHEINGLADGEVIEDRFKSDEYRIMVVANKFQTGYSQPLLAAMFLDKVVSGRNAVQTVSRLNRSCPGKDAVLVVDFTNNAMCIIQAFRTYRSGNPPDPVEPKAEDCTALLSELIERGAFTRFNVQAFGIIRDRRGSPESQSFIVAFRKSFETRFPDLVERRELVTLMARFVERWTFLSCFFDFSSEVIEAAAFADQIGPQLLRVSIVSEFKKQMSAVIISKGTVRYVGEIPMPEGTVGHKPGGSGGTGGAPPRVSINALIEELRDRFPISDEEALCIREVTEEKMGDESIGKAVTTNRDNILYLEGHYKDELNGEMQDAYNDRDRVIELADPKYIGAGGIFDIMAITVIDYFLGQAAS